VIAGALAYLMIPTDAINDLIPGFGLADDGVVIANAMMVVKNFITDDHRQKAKQLLKKFAL
jgi:uncharacterized membrane protein YkvA (DUF1232 family)